MRAWHAERLPRYSRRPLCQDALVRLRNTGMQTMKIWHKIVITLIAMLIASYFVGRLWLMSFDFVIPSHLAGVIGGLAAIPIWELLRWLDHKNP